MRTAAKRERRERAPPDVEPVGIRVATRIAIGRANEPEDQFASAQRLPMQDQVDRHTSPGVLDRAVEAQQFAHRARQPVWLALKFVPESGLGQQVI